MKKSKSKKLLTYCVICLVAVIAALNYHLFVFPNRFAPAGLNGICTMIQYITGISVGYMSLIINIPLAIAVYLKVSKSLAMRSMFYVAVFSIMLVVLEKVDLSEFAYYTETAPPPSWDLWQAASSSARATPCWCGAAPIPAARTSWQPSSISTAPR